MKKFLVIISFISILFSQDWQWELPKPFGNQMNDVFFINADTGWAVGNLGRLIRTYNGGVTWEILNCGMNANLQDSYFYKNLGWIAAGKTLLMTNDFGDNWTLKTFDYNISNISGVKDKIWINCGYGSPIYRMIDGKNWEQYPTGGYGFIAVNDTLCFTCTINTIKRSVDGGKSFDSLQVLQNELIELKRFSFINKDTGWVADNLRGNIFRTCDGGKSWKRLTSPNSQNYLEDIQFVNGKTGYVYNEWLYELYKTQDGGETWYNVGSPYFGSKAMFFINEFVGYSVTEIGIVQKTTDASLNWQIQNSEVVRGFENINFINENDAILTGSSIYYSSDKGKTWSVVFNSLDASDRYYPDVCNPEKNVIYNLGMKGTLLKSVDAGKTWTKLFIPVSNWYDSFNLISFINKDTGYVKKNKSGILKTTDGGFSWSEVSQMGTNIDLYFHFFNENDGCLVHRNGAHFTSDGGKTWKWKLGEKFSSDFYYHSAYFLDKNNGWVFFNDLRYTKMLYRTKDGGENWEQIIPNVELLTKIYFYDNLHGYGSTYDGFIYQTNDGGYNWKLENRLVDQNIRCFTKDYNGKIWACGYIFLISKKDSNLTAIKEENKTEIPTTFELKQNYPNPFNPSTTIEYSIPEAGIVTLKVYNLLGQEIKTLVNEYKPAGKHSELFTLRSSLSSGIYYCTLKSGRYTKSIKMILLK